MNSAAHFFIKQALKIKTNQNTKTESLLMILGIVISVAVVITATNLFEGYQRTIQKILLDTTAHVYIYSKRSPTISSLETKSIISKLSNTKPSVGQVSSLVNKNSGQKSMLSPTIKSINPLIANSAMVRKNKKVIGGYVRAYQISDGNMSEFWFYSYLSKKNTALKSGELIIGQNMAKDLSITIGDTITMMNPQSDNLSPVGLVTKQKSFIIANVIKTGYYEMDKTLIIMQWDDALSFYNYEPQSTYLEVFLNDNHINKTDKIINDITSMIGSDYYLQSWKDLNSNLFNLIKMEKWLIMLVFCFLIFIAALNSVSSVSTMVIERSKDFGIMKALGMKTADIKLIVYFRTLFLCLIAIFLGLILGTFTSWLITIQSMYQLKNDVYFIDKITMQVSALNYILILFIALALISFSIKFPINKIDKVQVIDILRGL